MTTEESDTTLRALIVALAGTWGLTLAIGTESVAIEVIEALPLVALGVCLGATQHVRIARALPAQHPARRRRNTVLAVMAVAAMVLGAVAGSGFG